MKVLIIGNSAAAIGCIEGIRSHDVVTEITVITDEKYMAYSRPLISYYLWGKADKKNMHYRENDFYEKTNVTLITSQKVVSIDTVKKQVTTNANLIEKYDKLLIATGASPFVPPVDGLEGKSNVFTFLKWDDAEELKKVVGKDKNAVVVGAGLIGIKVSEGLLPHCNSVTIVELAERVLPMVLDEASSKLVAKIIEEKGIALELGNSAVKIEGKTSVESVLLKDGKELPCDILVMAVGVRPNVQLAKDANIEVGRGIKVNEYSMTNKLDIYAAGDVTESFDSVAGDQKIMALWPNAYLQGETAGLHMSGAIVKKPTLFPMNSVTIFGYPIITAGIQPDASCLVLEKEDNDGLARLIFRENKLVGMMLLGKVDRAGIYTSMIHDGTFIERPELLLEDRFGLNWFSKEERKEKMK